MRTNVIKKMSILGIIVCLISLMLPAFSCSNAGALTIKKGNVEQSLSMAEIKALPVTEGTTYWMSHTGEIYGPYSVKGVSLDDICGCVDELGEGEGAKVTATDNWISTFTCEQMQNNDFKAYDRASGDKIVSDDLIVVVAYEVDGEPIDSADGGPLWTVITCPTDHAVYGAYFVKWTNSVEICNTAAEWTVALNGVVEEELTHTTFAQISSPSKHGVSWTDEVGNLWEGVPLWLLAARVDDAEGETCELNQTLADAGYNVYMEASDGYSKSLAIADIRQHDDWVVADRCNGQPINVTEHNWPLKLVGPKLIDAFRIGGITEIRLLLPES